MILEMLNEIFNEIDIPDSMYSLGAVLLPVTETASVSAEVNESTLHEMPQIAGECDEDSPEDYSSDELPE